MPPKKKAAAAPPSTHASSSSIITAVASGASASSSGATLNNALSAGLDERPLGEAEALAGMASPPPGSLHSRNPPHCVPLLARAGTLALELNIDCFQPHSSSETTLRVAYLTVLNLPREERYLAKNTVLLCVLPGPKMSSREQIQGALRPMVDELLILACCRSLFRLTASS